MSFAEMDCSIAQTLEVVGEWWSLLIVRDALLGISRFDEFQERLGISRNVLNQRLGRLVEEGVLEKVPYQDHPPRFDYRLTDKGRALLPVITAIRQWGDEWILGEDAAPIVVEHTTCGHVSKGVLMCDHCHEELTTRTLRARRGPGFRDDVGLLPSGL